MIFMEMAIAESIDKHFFRKTATFTLGIDTKGKLLHLL